MNGLFRNTLFVFMLLFAVQHTTQAQYFTWDNATVYFLLTDRFNNGDTSNDFAYGRTSDPVGGFLGGDFVGITQKINDGYFDDLGVNAIWVTAPYEQIHGYVPGYGTDPAFQKHYAYHGYYALDFTETDDNYGTEAEFQAMVDAAHNRGIRIVMDIVLNHVGYDNQGDSDEFGLGPVSDPDDAGWCNWWRDPSGNSWIRKGDTATDYCAPASGGGDLELALAGLPDILTDLTTPVDLPQILLTKWDATKEAQEVAELNTFFTNTGLTRTPANHIVKWLTDWVRDYGIDGFRIDTYKHVERAIWGELKVQAQDAFDDWKTANPGKVLDNNDFWMVGEWYGHGPGKNLEVVDVGKTDAIINFNFKGPAANPGSIEGTYANYASIVNPDPEWNILSYISSHDDDMFPRADLIDAGTSLLLAPGGVQIYYGDESARPLGTMSVGTDQPWRSFMNWGSFNTAVHEHWKKLGTFRYNHPAVGAGSHTQISASPYMFKREYINANDGICDIILAAIGLSAGTQSFDVSGCFEDGDQVKDHYSGATATVSGGQVSFNVSSEGVVLMEYVTAPACIAIDIAPTDCYSPDPVTVTISAADVGGGGSVTTYYTFDPDATPSDLSDWTVYTMPFTLNSSTTVYAFAQDGMGNNSSVKSQQYVIGGTATMTIHWNAGACGTPYAYAWELNGVEDTEAAPWPGVAMTDADGDGWYEVTLNAAYANIIFNCAGGSQTDDLFACGDACYDGGWTACPSFAPTVNISPLSGNHPSGSVTVTLGTGSNVCDIYYTTDGTTPTTSSTLYTGPFTVSGAAGIPETVQAIADCGGTLTAVDTETYTFDPVQTMTLYWNADAAGCATPTMYYWDVDGGMNSPTTWPGVTMTDPDGDGWYEYTITGSSTNVIFSCNGAGQTGDLSASGDSCYDNGWVTCPGFGLPTVAISPASTNFPSGSGTITLTSTNATAIYYTTDGTTPTTSSTLYTGSFTVSGGAPVNVQAISTDGTNNSSLASETYTFDPAAMMTLYWNADAAGCNDPYIYYWNTDGGTNNPVSWPGVPMTDADGDGWYEYTIMADDANIIFSCNGAGQTADLFHVGDGCYDSGWVTCPGFGLPTVAISPASTNFPSGSGTITLTSTNATDIYYTTDGSTPTTSSTLYTGPFTVSGGVPVTVSAISTDGTNDSSVATETYTFTPAPSMTVQWDASVANCATPYIYYWDLDGGTNNPVTWPGVAISDADANGWYEYTIPANSANIIFHCNDGSQTADLFQTGDGCYNGPSNTSSDNSFWTTCPTTMPTVDVTPASTNFPSGSGTVTINSTNATAIYYTTDGTIPTTSSILYTGPFMVSGGSPVTITAISTDGTNNSATDAETYTFNPAASMTLTWNPGSCTDPYIYYWDIDGGTNNPVVWPGVPMADPDGDGCYEFTINASTANIIFSCNGANQTVDLFQTGDACYDGGWIPCSSACSTTPPAPGGTVKKVVLQAFWWDYEHDDYPDGWANYLADLAPRFRASGVDAIWIPPSIKNLSLDPTIRGVGYAPFDHYDLGDKYQKGATETRLGTKDELLRMIAVMHANGIEVIQDVVPNHVIGAGSENVGLGGIDPASAGDMYYNFRYACFGTPIADGVANQTAAEYLSREGRFPKNFANFFNPDVCTPGDQICEAYFGPDIDYSDNAHGTSSNAIYNPAQTGGTDNGYMRRNVREWMVWYKKQTGFDGVRVDAVKHFDVEACEDFIYNIQQNAGWANGSDAMFAVGEYVGSTGDLDAWYGGVMKRAGVFDFNLRAFDFTGGLYGMVYGSGGFDMQNLPGAQQTGANRVEYYPAISTYVHRTVPFVNNHDTYRPNLAANGNVVGWNAGSELSAHITPTEPRLAAAYATIIGMDGNPQIFFEDMFNVFNTGQRFTHDPNNNGQLPINDDIVNLIQAHQKLDFKAGSYAVPSSLMDATVVSGSKADHLVLERTGVAVIGVTDKYSTVGNNSQDEEMTVTTSFSNVALYDYSGAHGLSTANVDASGRVTIRTAPVGHTIGGANGHGYSIWAPAPAGVTFSSVADMEAYLASYIPQRATSTTQEWEMADDLGDSHCLSLTQGGRIPDLSCDYRVVGKIFVESGKAVTVDLTPTDAAQDLTMNLFDLAGLDLAVTSGTGPITLNYMPSATGWLTIKVRNTSPANTGQECTVKATYTAPQTVSTNAYPSENTASFWIGRANDGDWNNCSNWEEGMVPGNTDTVIFPDCLTNAPTLPSTFTGALLREDGTPYITIQLSVKVNLQGPYSTATSVMTHALSTSSLVPNAQPYTSFGYSGSETIQASAVGNTGNDRIVDWVLLELRDPSSPTTVVATRAALLQKDGDVVDTDGNSAVRFDTDPGMYHVVVRHRNHLGVMTKDPVQINTN